MQRLAYSAQIGHLWLGALGRLSELLMPSYAPSLPTCRGFGSMLMFVTEEITMDLDSASLSDPRTRQPRSMVPSRPLETRLHPLHRRWRNRHRSPPRLEPRYDALSRLHRKLNNKISAYSQGRRLARLCGARKCRRRGMDPLSAILQLCLFREYRTEVSAKWREQKIRCSFQAKRGE